MAARTVIACHHCGTKNGVRPVPDGRPRCKQCHKPLAWIVDARTDSFDEEISSSLPMVVDFWAAWCGPCRMVAPALESLARRFAGSFKLVRVDIDQAATLAQRFAVQGVPTLVLLRGGGEVDRRVGAAPEVNSSGGCKAKASATPPAPPPRRPVRRRRRALGFWQHRKRVGTTP